VSVLGALRCGSYSVVVVMIRGALGILGLHARAAVQLDDSLDEGDVQQPLIDEADNSAAEPSEPAPASPEHVVAPEWCGIDARDPELGGRGLVDVQDLIGAHADDVVRFLKRQGVRQLGEIELVRVPCRCKMLCGLDY
jgi:hypothetical protein